MTKTTINQDGFQGRYFASRQRDIALLVLGGSEGSVAFTNSVAKSFSAIGISALAVYYFRTIQTGCSLSNIPVETIEHAVNWLKNSGTKKIIVYGLSKGAELALLAASLIAEINGVIAVSGSCCIFEGLTWNLKSSGKSSWQWRDNEVPYVSTSGAVPSFFSTLIKNGEMNYFDSFNRLLEVEMTENTVIRVENIKGPILLLSAKEDVVWPSKRMNELIIKRLEEKKFKYDYSHKTFSPASHFLTPTHQLIYSIFRLERNNKPLCSLARQQAFDCSLNFLADF